MVEKVQIGDHKEEHKVFWHILNENFVNIFILGPKFVNRHGVFDEKYESAMVEVGGLEGPELYYLWKGVPIRWIKEHLRKFRHKDSEKRGSSALGVR